MGKQAMAMLVRMMQREKGGNGLGGDQIVVLNNELRVRDSTAPPFRS
jgi:DNA-binding LacI/PurR family transcriptional regulator